MQIREKIKTAGLKATPQRRAIYEIMQEVCHCPIDEVITRIKEQQPDVTVSTVYRIMDSFCETGLLTKFVNSEGKTIFDITPFEHHHIQTADNNFIDLDDKQLSTLIKKRILDKLPDGEEIENIQIQITTKAKAE